jgi:hypothetical protein
VVAAVNILEELWETYVKLYFHMCQWAGTFVPETSARKVARLALARLFQLACTAWETTQGPFAELGDLAVPLIINEGLSGGGMTFDPFHSTIPLPDHDLLWHTAKLYANVYQLVYFGQWSMTERESIAMAIRVYDPIPHDVLWLKLHITESSEPLPILRRAVDRADVHECGHHLICEAAYQIFTDEGERGIRWARQLSQQVGGVQ